MASYQELLKQRDELEKKIQEVRQQELTDAIAKVRSLVQEYDLGTEDVFPPARAARSSGAGSKVAPKYRHPETGETWTGRGKPPKWIQDQDRSKFEI